MKVKGVAAMTSIPMYLNTKAPHLKSLKDLTPNDKIAVTAVKVSIPAIIMQMQAIKEFGKADYAKYDPYTVSLTHPDGVIALLSGKTEVTAHFTSPPFHQRERKDPAVRTITTSNEIMGGPSTFTMLYAPSKFYDENPKVYAAVLKALQAAIDFINADKKAAADVFLASERRQGLEARGRDGGPQRSRHPLHHLAGERDEVCELHGRCRLDQAAAEDVAGDVLPGHPRRAGKLKAPQQAQTTTRRRRHD